MSAFRRRALDLAIAALSVIAMFACGPKNPQVMNRASGETSMKNESGSPIHVIAFTEQPAVKGQPIQLHVHIINESKSPLAIWNELNSINIPKNPPGDGIAPSSELTHVDFGVSESAKFVTVGPAECVKISLILRETQLAQLDRVQAVKVPVKFRDGNNEQTKLVQSKVHKAHVEGL